MIFVNSLDDMPTLKTGDQYITTDKSDLDRHVHHVETYDGEKLVDDEWFTDIGQAARFAMQRERELKFK